MGALLGVQAWLLPFVLAGAVWTLMRMVQDWSDNRVRAVRLQLLRDVNSGRVGVDAGREVLEELDRYVYIKRDATLLRILILSVMTRNRSKSWVDGLDRAQLLTTSRDELERVTAYSNRYRAAVGWRAFAGNIVSLALSIFFLTAMVFYAIVLALRERSNHDQAGEVTRIDMTHRRSPAASIAVEHEPEHAPEVWHSFASHEVAKVWSFESVVHGSVHAHAH